MRRACAVFVAHVTGLCRNPDKFCFVFGHNSRISASSRPDWEGQNRSGGGQKKGRIEQMRFGETMLNLNTMNPNFRTLYIFALIALWVGATIANIATIANLSVDGIGLTAVSVFISGMILRSYMAFQDI